MASSALLCEFLNASTALADCCGFDLCHKIILYLYLYLYCRHARVRAGGRVCVTGYVGRCPGCAGRLTGCVGRPPGCVGRLTGRYRARIGSGRSCRYPRAQCRARGHTRRRQAIQARAAAGPARGHYVAASDHPGAGGRGARRGDIMWRRQAIQARAAAGPARGHHVAASGHPGAPAVGACLF